MYTYSISPCGGFDELISFIFITVSINTVVNLLLPIIFAFALVLSFRLLHCLACL